MSGEHGDPGGRRMGMSTYASYVRGFADGRRDERVEFLRWIRAQADACTGERREAMLDIAKVGEGRPVVTPPPTEVL